MPTVRLSVFGRRLAFTSRQEQPAYVELDRFEWSDAGHVGVVEDADLAPRAVAKLERLERSRQRIDEPIEAHFVLGVEPPLGHAIPRRCGGGDDLAGPIRHGPDRTHVGFEQALSTPPRKIGSYHVVNR